MPRGWHGGGRDYGGGGPSTGGYGGTGLFRFRITGLKEVQKRLLALPPKLERRVVAQAVRAAGRPILQVMKSILRPHRHTGNLLRSLGTRIRKYGSGSVVGIYGPRTKIKGERTGQHATLVDKGTKERWQKTTGRYTGRMPAIPYREPAYRAAKGRIVPAFQRKILQALDRLVREGKANV